jgi:RNA polymerase sigma factor (sigma-70 family)
VGPTERRRLFAHHHEALRKFVRGLTSNKHEADELLQDTAVVVFGHHSGPVDARSFPSWCQGVARFVAAHRRRAFARLYARIALWDDLEGEAGTTRYDETLDDPEHTAIARELLAIHLGGLEEPERMLFHALFVDGETPSEVARRWKISSSAVRMRLMRLRLALRTD